METRTVKIPNPFKWIGDSYQKAVENNKKKKAEKRSMESIPQNQYFANLIQWINSARRKILIGGYDAPFMNNPETIEALTKVAKGYDDRNQVEISAIFPDSEIHPAYKKLAEETVFFNILTTPDIIPDGVIVIDNWAATLWNSKKPTTYLPEVEKGVIARLAMDEDIVANKGTRIFYDLEKRVRQKQMQ